MSGDGNGCPSGDGPGPPARTVSIVVPTLREARNIRPLAERIDAALAGSGIAWELLLVDDGSGDGSEVVAARWRRAYRSGFTCGGAFRPGWRCP